MLDTGDGDKSLVLKGKIKSYKPKSMSKNEKDNLKLIIRNGAGCDCDPAEKANKSSLVMASKVGNTFIVTYISDWIRNKEFKRAIRAIRKGHDCKLQIEEPGQSESINGGLSINGSPLPTVDGPETDNRTNGDKDGRKKGKGKGRKRKKDRKKDKKKNKDDEDPMANFGMLDRRVLYKIRETFSSDIRCWVW